MALYRYKAISEKGQVLEGYKEAQSELEVARMLKNSNYYPVIIKKDVDSNNKKNFFSKKVSKKDISLFCRQFYTMLNAGISIVNCLEILEKQVINKSLKKAIFELYEDVQKGLTLSEGMRKQNKIFPTLLINMVEAGEVSGNLDVLMKRMATHYDKECKIENKFKNALVYPLFLITISIFVVLFLLIVVMPTFISIFESNSLILPLSTRILLAISNWIKGHWYMVTVGLILATPGVIYICKTSKGRYLIDTLKIRIPGIKKLNIKINTSRFTRTLSILLSSGIPILQALDMVNKVVGNTIISEKLRIAKEDIKKGVPISKAVKNVGIFPPMVDSMLKVGEESGALDDLLYLTADYYDEEVEISMERITTLLEPILIVLMAFIVGFIVVSMTMPMFDMINTIQI